MQQALIASINNISVKTQYKAKPPVNNCGSGSRTNACSSNFTCSNGLKSNTQFYSKHRNSHWSRNLQWLTPARFIDPIWLTGFPNIRKYKYFDRKTFPSWIILDSVSSLQEVIPLHRSRMCTLQADYKSMIKHDPAGKLAKWLYGFSVASTDSRH